MDFFSLVELQKNIKSKKLSAKEVFNFYFQKIQKHNQDLKAFLDLNEKLLETTDWDRLEGPLSGIPLAVKDIFLCQGFEGHGGVPNAGILLSTLYSDRYSTLRAGGGFDSWQMQ